MNDYIGRVYRDHVDGSCCLIIDLFPEGGISSLCLNLTSGPFEPIFWIDKKFLLEYLEVV